MSQRCGPVGCTTVIVAFGIQSIRLCRGERAAGKDVGAAAPCPQPRGCLH